MSLHDDRPLDAADVSVRFSRTKTLGGVETQSVYSPDDIADLSYDDLGAPGVYPYTRGSYPEMYRSRVWTLRNIVGYGTPEDTRSGLQGALAQGSGGLDIIVDTLSQEAIDPDHPSFRADVGKEGCSLSCVADLERLLEGVDITKTDIAWHISVLGYPMIAAYARKHGMNLADLQGSHMPDYLGLNPMGLGERLMPARLAHRATLDCLEFVADNSPKWACGFPQAYNLVQRGLTASGEIAVGMAIAVRTLEDLQKRGLDVDRVAPSLAWVSPAGIDLFEQVAKFRALRRMWARTLKDRLGATSARSLRLRIACHTDGRALTYQQPLNNLTRAAVQTLAAILGGVQSVETCTYDEAISIPTPEARELAIRTQQILIHEVGAARTADPLGGSYYVEKLTNQLEAQARTLLDKIEERDLVDAIESGWIESLMDEQNIEATRELTNGERIVVGVNAFQPASDTPPPRFEVDEQSVSTHITSFASWRAGRDRGSLASALAEVRHATETGQNTVPAMVDAFVANATIGEVWGTFREASGYSYDPFAIVSNPFPAG